MKLTYSQIYLPFFGNILFKCPAKRYNDDVYSSVLRSDKK